MDPEVIHFELVPLAPTSLSGLPPPSHGGDGYFFLKFQITNGYVKESSMEDEDQRPEVYRYFHREYGWRIQKEAMIQQTGSSSFILSGILFAMNVPQTAQSSMVDQILACAFGMATRTHRAEKVLGIFVEVIIARSKNEDPLNMVDEEESDSDFESEEDEEGEDDHDDENFKWIPTADSSVERLERVKLGEEGSSFNGVCIICLDDFAVDLEAIRMPCLHIFHQNCIVSWLQKANSCPMCRFTMPTTEFGC